MDVKNTITRAAGKGKLFVIKKSPELCVVGTIIFGGLAVISAVKQTITGAGEILDKHLEMMDKIYATETVTDDQGNSEEYFILSEKDQKKAKAAAYMRTGWAFGKLYAKPAVLFGMSVACTLTGHGIMKKRNIALATTLATVRNAWDDYRGRVIKELGAEKDEHFLYDTVEEVKEEKVIDEETGKEKKVKKKVQTATKTSVYSKFFDEANPNHHKDDGNANYKFIRAQLIYLRRKQIANGYLFLNDVYKQLGLPISIAGQSAGWIYDYDNPEGTLINFKGFNEIDNDMYLSQAVRDLRNGYETNVLLDFENIMDDILTDIPRVNTEVTAV